MDSYEEVEKQKAVLEGLKKACKRSKRQGKWSTISEVSHFVKSGIAVSSNLTILVKKGSAEKKKKALLYRPTNLGGWFGGDGDGEEGLREIPKTKGEIRLTPPKTEDFTPLDIGSSDSPLFTGKPAEKTYFPKWKPDNQLGVKEEKVSKINSMKKTKAKGKTPQEKGKVAEDVGNVTAAVVTSALLGGMGGGGGMSRI